MLEAIDALRADRRRASSTGRSATRRGSATTAGGSATSTEFRRDYPAGGSRYGIEDDPAGDPRAQRRALDVRRREALGRHPRAQRGRVDRRDGRGLGRGARAREEIDYEVIVVDDAEHDGTASGRRDAGRRRIRASAAVPLPPTARLRLRGAGRARPLRGRRGRDRDGGRLRLARRPRRLLSGCSRTATTAPSARASCGGSQRPRLSALQARRSTGSSTVVIRVALPPRLQRHDERLQGLPARGDRERPAAALEPLQPHRRAAAEGDRPRPQLRDRADLLDEPEGRASRSSRCRRWAAATCSSSSTSSSSTTSAAATTGARRAS